MGSHLFKVRLALVEVLEEVFNNYENIAGDANINL